MPDRVIDEADEVVVVDLTPEALQARLIEGKVFPAGSVPVALERFFTKDNLDVLREMALLQVVEEVEAHRLTAEMLTHEDRLISNLPAERSHRFLALVKPDPSANRIIRRAWTISEQLGGPLDLLWVAPPEHDDDRESARRVDELRRLAAAFGAHMIVEHDRNVARAVARVADDRAATYIVMGTPHLRRRLSRLDRSLVDEIIADHPGLDLVLVGDAKPNPDA
jgi:two-component system sensor histidine kinase KdpD